MAISDNIRTGGVPAGLPVLGRGRHRDAAAGSCLMEYVSVLAGERFCDHPRTTHRGLSHLARYVNDSVGDQQRGELARLAPGLIGTASSDPAVWDLLVEQCITAGLRVTPGDPGLTLHARAVQTRRNRARTPRPRWRRRLQRWVSVRAETRLHEASTSLHRVLGRCAPAHREQVRAALLDDATRAVRAHLGLAAVTGLASIPAPTPTPGPSIRTP